MNVKQRREHVLRILSRRNRYQFGQPAATTTLVKGGAVACTDTSIQMIVQLAKGKNVSLNGVRRRSGAPQDVPMKASQALQALRSYGLPYEMRTGLLASDIVRIAKTKGPVIIAEKYWAHPQWLDYTYAGKTLKGYATNDAGARVRVGISKPPRRSGLNQWTFRGGHAVLVATALYEGGRNLPVVRDPNHNSPARPERPAYDTVTMYQLNRMLKSWPVTTVALVPTRVVIK